MYWERQQGPDTCRMHAVNAYLGGPKYTWPSFMAMCDRYDEKAKLPKGTSRLLYNAMEGCTLFQFALQEAGSTARTVPLAMYSTGKNDNRADFKTPAKLEDAIAHGKGAFAFNAQHVWLMKPSSTGWIRVDSLSGIQKSTLQSVWRDGIGIEVIYDDGQKAESDQCSVTPPFVPEVDANLPASTPIIRASGQREIVQPPPLLRSRISGSAIPLNTARTFAIRQAHPYRPIPTIPRIISRPLFPQTFAYSPSSHVPSLPIRPALSRIMIPQVTSRHGGLPRYMMTTSRVGRFF
jgi:hypothetical protein